MFFNNSTYSSPSEQGAGLDYKLFIREFERYRTVNPDQSFQEALNKFMATHQQQTAESRKALV